MDTRKDQKLFLKMLLTFGEFQDTEESNKNLVQICSREKVPADQVCFRFVIDSHFWLSAKNFLSIYQ